MIYAVVVLYNPMEGFIKNINSYIDKVDKVLLIDNSDKADSYDWSSLNEKVLHISMEGNKGIAYALKYGMDYSIKNGANFVLTMDQDSYFKENEFSKMIDYIEEMDVSKVAIISPNIQLIGKNASNNNGVESIKIAISSGCIINSKLYKKISGFDDKLFIDCVDFDLCRQFLEAGFIIERMNEVHLIHELGSSIEKRILWKKVTVSAHSPMRYYYYARNFEYCKNKTVFSKKYFKEMEKDYRNMMIKLVLFESNKIGKLKACCKGKKDGLRGKMELYKKN